jgi:hypothetical protein
MGAPEAAEAIRGEWGSRVPGRPYDRPPQFAVYARTVTGVVWVLVGRVGDSAQAQVLAEAAVRAPVWISPGLDSVHPAGHALVLDLGEEARETLAAAPQRLERARWVDGPRGDGIPRWLTLDEYRRAGGRWRERPYVG